MTSLSNELSLVLNEGLISLTLSDRKIKESPVVKIIIRPIKIKDATFYQVSSHFSRAVDHKNLSHEELLLFICTQLESTFKQALIHTIKSDTHLLISKKGKASFIKKKPTLSLKVLSHDKEKNYLLKEGDPIAFLVHLGIMSPVGTINASKHDKFRQINHFLKIVDESIEILKNQPRLTILDFGCGSAYLTFALYHYLHDVLKKDVHIIGLDLKKEVIENCRELARKCNYENLEFFVGDINDFSYQGKVDLMVTLHACDTATDAALEKAVRWAVKVILSVPCCQHELFKQVKNDGLTPLLKHGILKEKFSSLLTDSARGCILEILGYKVDIIEFIDMEHTPKNILIKAVLKEDNKAKKTGIEQYMNLKKQYLITPDLEVRFHDEIFSKSSYDDPCM